MTNSVLNASGEVGGHMGNLCTFPYEPTSVLEIKSLSLYIYIYLKGQDPHGAESSGEEIRQKVHLGVQGCSKTLPPSEFMGFPEDWMPESYSHPQMA